MTPLVLEQWRIVDNRRKSCFWFSSWLPCPSLPARTMHSNGPVSPYGRTLSREPIHHSYWTFHCRRSLRSLHLALTCSSLLPPLSRLLALMRASPPPMRPHDPSPLILINGVIGKGCPWLPSLSLSSLCPSALRELSYLPCLYPSCHRPVSRFFPQVKIAILKTLRCDLHYFRDC